MSEEEYTTEEDGIGIIIAPVGEYKITSAVEGVALDGTFFIANKYYDHIQSFETLLKTAFLISVDRECTVRIKDSDDNYICSDGKFENMVYSCETSEKFNVNQFVVEISGEGIATDEHIVLPNLDENFVYVA